MKFSIVFPVALIYSGFGTASEESNAESLAPRAGTSTCSLGIGREISSVNSWDVTIYNVPQSQRQDVNIIARLTNAFMDKGDSISVNGPQNITITNVDNAPAFSYDVGNLVAPLDNPDSDTKVQLSFKIEGTDTTWTTANCSAQSVVWSGGRESWECEFPCTLQAEKEL